MGDSLTQRDRCSYEIRIGRRERLKDSKLKAGCSSLGRVRSAILAMQEPAIELEINRQLEVHIIWVAHELTGWNAAWCRPATFTVRGNIWVGCAVSS
jgi:hypothetical protein